MGSNIYGLIGPSYTVFWFAGLLAFSVYSHAFSVSYLSASSNSKSSNSIFDITLPAVYSTD